MCNALVGALFLKLIFKLGLTRFKNGIETSLFLLFLICSEVPDT